MLFWTIFWPVFSALVGAFMITEIFHLGLGYYLHKKQDKARQELEAKIARGEIDPMDMMLGLQSPGMALPTKSGESPDMPQASHGQYL